MSKFPPKVAEVVFGLPVEGPFDYSIDTSIQKSIAVGQRVKVLFNRRRCIGYVSALKENSEFQRLNPVIQLMDEGECILRDLFSLAVELRAYYGCTLGEALEIMVPASLRRGKIVEHPSVSQYADQGQEGSIKYLHDLGQTKRFEVLFDAITKTLKSEQSVIICVPENYYIPDISERLKNLFPDIEVFSAMKSRGAKRDVEDWLSLKTGSARIILGTRHVIFSPVRKLGMIVVFDENNRAFKQEQTPHYHLREVALMRAGINRCDLLFMGSTPSMESWNKIIRKEWDCLTFKSDHLAEAQLIDLTNYNPRKMSVLAPPLQNTVKAAFEEKKQGMFLLPQRDFEPWVDKSKNTQYPSKADKIMNELMRFYPQANVLRYDNHTKKLSNPARADFIIATQAVLKASKKIYPHFIAVTNIDAPLSYFDFRCSENVFAMLYGLRQIAKGKVIIQTKISDHHCLQAVLKGDVKGFAEKELNVRKELDLPPYKHLAAVGLRGKKEAHVSEQCKTLFEALEQAAPKAVQVMDSYSSSSHKLPEVSRYTIMLKAQDVREMVEFIKNTLSGLKRKAGVIVTIDVDP